MDILLYNLCKSSPQNNIMPIRPIRNLSAIGQGISTLGCCKRQASNGNPLINISDIGFLANISNKHHLIHTSNIRLSNNLTKKIYLKPPRYLKWKFFPFADGN